MKITNKFLDNNYFLEKRFVLVLQQKHGVKNENANFESSDDSLTSNSYQDYDVESVISSKSRRVPLQDNNKKTHTIEKRNQTDYDLSTCVKNSQNLFELRMTQAKTPAKNFVRLKKDESISDHFLDRSVACEPNVFSNEWDSLPQSFQITYITQHLPLMRELHEHMEYNRVFIIASGVVGDGIMKLFLIAQCQGSKCLMEMEFDPSNNKLFLQLKAHEKHKISYFLECLKLQQLFGDGTESTISREMNGSQVLELDSS